VEVGKIDFMIKKITMYQGTTEYPSLHLMITDNPRFQEGKLCLESTEDAILKISTWLNRKLENDN